MPGRGGASRGLGLNFQVQQPAKGRTLQSTPFPRAGQVLRGRGYLGIESTGRVEHRRLSAGQCRITIGRECNTHGGNDAFDSYR